MTLSVTNANSQASIIPSRSTGKERDAESGNDYFGARYYASSMGRWLSPDWAAKAEPVPYAKLDDPQTLNLYRYMRNNPLGGVDADGHCPWCLALAGGGVLADESPLAFTGPVGWTIIGVTAVGVAGVAIYHHMHSENSSEQGTSQQPAPAETPKKVYIDPNKYPAAAGHAEDAQKAGQPDVVTVQTPGASGRRAAATSGTSTQAGTDRDEYPPAVTAEGGKGASVRNIPSQDNRGAGASVGQQIRDVPNGGKIQIVPKPKPQD